MARTDRFVKPTDKDGKLLVDRLPLGDGDWIEVKKQLSIGEVQTIERAGMRDYHQVRGEQPAQPRIDVDLNAYALVRNFMWLADWSFRDADDKPVALTISAVAALEPETFTEIEDAISAHITAIAKAKTPAAPAGSVDASATQ
jgi:hypothetical protein